MAAPSAPPDNSSRSPKRSPRRWPSTRPTNIAPAKMPGAAPPSAGPAPRLPSMCSALQFWTASSTRKAAAQRAARKASAPVPAHDRRASVRRGSGRPACHARRADRAQRDSRGEKRDAAQDGGRWRAELPRKAGRDRRNEHGQREHGVRSEHQPCATLGLDVADRGVHRHVERPRARANEEQGRRENEGSAGKDRPEHRHGEEDAADGQHPPPEAAPQAAGEQHRRDRADAGEQEGDAELAVSGADLCLHVGNERRPRSPERAERRETGKRPPRGAAHHGRPGHIRKTPNFVSGIGALRAAEIASARTSRVCAGSITPSSHSRAVEW